MNTITTTNTQLVTATAADEARKLRDELLTRAKDCPLITSPETQAQGTNLLRELRNFYKMIEIGREAAKAPVLQIGRDIDALAQELYGQVEAEGKRLSAVLGSYDIEQKRIAEQKRQEAAREELRIRREAEAKERAEQERQEKLTAQARAEVARQQALIAKEAEEKAARARTEAGRERAAKEAELRAAQLAEKARQDAIEAAAKADREAKARFEEEARKVAEARQAAVPAVVKPKDTATSEKIVFEITDITALYEAAPYMVTLSPNNAAIKSALKGMADNQSMPGVKWWKEASTITRG